ncbi:MAG: hypothetical protein RI564_13485 [Gracilimonas sp.]|jgi:hypothetical protein|nr:hypothetical protein [Gracilimonas sp.]
MYKDLAEATEALRDKGFEHTFELGDQYITCKKLDLQYDVGDLQIRETHKFDQGTDPGSESTIYAIESESGVKGTLIISYGKYVDPDKATLIDKLLKTQKN